MADIGQLIEWMTSGLMLRKERGNETLQENGLLSYSLLCTIVPVGSHLVSSLTSTFLRMAIIGMFFQDGLTGWGFKRKLLAIWHGCW